MTNYKETENLITINGLDSSAIRGFVYDKETKILTITFTSGGHYDYPDVPLSVIYDWLKADSKGKFYNREIRNVYSY